MLALGAALSPTRPFANVAAAQSQPKTGGSVTMTLYADAVSFDPPVPSDNPSIWTMLNVYDQLVRVGRDGRSVEPGLAASWDVSPDKLTWTFHLRDAKLPDGTPVTSEDVVYSLERVFKSPSVGSFYAAFKSVTAPDPKTVVTVLKQIWEPALADLSLYGASILPKKLVEANADKFFNQPVGSGPFYVAEWAKGDHITLKRNPNYWGQGQPYLDEVVFTVVGDDNTRVIQLQAGQIDIASDVPYNQIAGLKQTSGIVVQTDPLLRVDYVAFNHTRAPFDDVNVRKAINYAVNKEQIIKIVLFGYGTVAQSLLPQMLDWNKAGKPYPYDPAQAKAVLAQSKVPQGFTTTLMIDAGNSVQQQYATIIQKNLGEIGIKVKIQPVEATTLYTDYFQKYQYDMLAQYHTTDIVDPDEITSYALDPQGGTGAIWTGYKNPKSHQLALAAEGEQDPEKRAQMYAEIQQMSLDDAQVLFLYFPTSRTGLRDWVHGFKVLPTANYRMWEVWTTKG